MIATINTVQMIWNHIPKKKTNKIDSNVWVHCTSKSTMLVYFNKHIFHSKNMFQLIRNIHNAIKNSECEWKPSKFKYGICWMLIQRSLTFGMCIHFLRSMKLNELESIHNIQNAAYAVIIPWSWSDSDFCWVFPWTSTI